MSLLLRLLRLLAVLLALALTAIAGIWLWARPVAPDAFYTPPPDVPARAGVLLRQEPFTRQLPAGARGWRILYTTTRDEGMPAVASALVLLGPGAAPASGPRPVIAWAHGTTGVAPSCAPSLLAQPFGNIPALEPLLQAGWVLVATDYPGQGTTGPNPYLIGQGQARATLDSVRAAQQLTESGAGPRAVVWGHSQGGHAALWTGMLAPGYAPDVALLGVAALAPASDLPALVSAVQHTLVGRLMSAYLLRAYGDAYSDVRAADYTSGVARLAAYDIARYCLDGPGARLSVWQAQLVGRSLFSTPPDSGPFGARLAQNVPRQPIAAPVLLAEGLADDLVLPRIQQAYVRERCAAGQALDHRRYVGRDHLSLVAADSPLSTDVLAWSRARFAGEGAPGRCVQADR